MQCEPWKFGWRTAVSGVALAALAAAGCSGTEPAAPEPAPEIEEPASAPTLQGAHEVVDNPGETFTDERGLTVEGMGIDFAARRYPASEEFPTGPALGERLPEFTLPNQHGEPVDFHADRGGQGAVVVFYRSAVW